MSISTESSPFIITKQSKGYFYEFKWLFKNAIPLVISYLLQNSLQSVGILNAGHLVNECKYEFTNNPFTFFLY